MFFLVGATFALIYTPWIDALSIARDRVPKDGSTVSVVPMIGRDRIGAAVRVLVF
jgi:hypothetical protein